MAIAKYMEYAKGQGRYWAYRFPFLHDDIQAVAMLALVEAFEKKIPDPAKGYLSVCIRNAVNDLLERNNLIHIPRNERQRRRALKISLDTLPRAVLMEDLQDFRVSTDYPTWMVMQSKDVASFLKLTEREQEIIRLRAEGHTQEEIGQCFNVSDMMIRKILKSLQGRYLVMMREHPGVLRPHDSES